MFELTKQPAKMTVHVRPEIHGEDRISAMDLKFTAACSNEVLTYFDGFLKSALYKRDPVQEDMDTSHLPTIKFRELGPLKWEYLGLGYELVVHFGATGKGDIKQLECQVDKFKFTLQDGGSVIVEFRVIVHPGEKDAGKLYSMTGQQVEITLTPPDEPREF